MKPNTKISIYLQALGGKFLGPNAYLTNSIEVDFTLKGGKTKSVTYELTENANDGGIGPDFLSSLPAINGQSSFLPIITPLQGKPTQPAVNYLTPNSLTIHGLTEVDVETATLATVNARIPRSSGPKLELSETVALNPNQRECRVIMIVPGLLLEKAVPADMSDGLYVYVKMMCGCPITTGIGKSFWAADDFLVSAEIFDRGDSLTRKDLTFTSDATPSLFQVLDVDINNVKTVRFFARQKSTGNIGYVDVKY